MSHYRFFVEKEGRTRSDLEMMLAGIEPSHWCFDGENVRLENSRHSPRLFVISVCKAHPNSACLIKLLLSPISIDYFHYEDADLYWWDSYRLAPQKKRKEVLAKIRYRIRHKQLLSQKEKEFLAKADRLFNLSEMIEDAANDIDEMSIDGRFKDILKHPMLGKMISYGDKKITDPAWRDLKMEYSDLVESNLSCWRTIDGWYIKWYWDHL